MKIGSARVSARAQNVALQRKALTHAGCGPIQHEKASEAVPARVELGELPGHLRPDNTVHSHQLDRLGRFLKHWFDLVAELQRRGVDLVLLTDAINTAPAQGRLGLNLFAALGRVLS